MTTTKQSTAPTDPKVMQITLGDLLRIKALDRYVTLGMETTSPFAYRSSATRLTISVHGLKVDMAGELLDLLTAQGWTLLKGRTMEPSGPTNWMVRAERPIDAEGGVVRLNAFVVGSGAWPERQEVTV